MNKSLKGTLRWLIIIVIAVVLIPLALIGYRRTLQEVNELADGRLAQAARTVDTLLDIGRNNTAQPDHQGRRLDSATSSTSPAIVAVMGKHCDVEGDSCEPEVGFQVVDASGHLRMQTANLVDLPPPLLRSKGFQDIRVGDKQWRTYAMTSSAGGELIRVAERHDSRAEITQVLRIDHGLSLLFALPLLAVLVGWALQRGLRPLDALAKTLTTRSPGSRSPIQLEPAPTELQPVLVALNQLLHRSEDTLERERRFSADMAHELRTPLSGIAIHLQNAEMANDALDSAESIAKARLGVADMARRIDQLLALAKIEAGAASEETEAWDLALIATEVIEGLAPLIHKQDAELSLRCDVDAHRFTVRGYEAALSAMMRNLIENALRHIPPGGVVEVALTGDTTHVYLDITDNGPGIPEHRREAVFARFHREPGARSDGLGLGLSIVQRAADLHGASIALLDTPSGQGLRVRVTFPACLAGTNP